MTDTNKEILSLNAVKFMELNKQEIDRGCIPVITIMLKPSGCAEDGIRFVSGLSYQKALEFLGEVVTRSQAPVGIDMPPPKGFQEAMEKKLINNTIVDDYKAPFEVQAQDEVKFMEGKNAEEVLASMRERGITPNLIAGCSADGINAYFFLDSAQVKEYLLDLYNWWDKYLMENRK